MASLLTNTENSTLPLVSVALCTYNGARYLRAQLDSLLRQTYPNLEVVVTDDGSKDETLAILASYQQKLPLRVYRNETNLGYIRNFEKALSLCSGTFLAPCDQDDVWHPEKLHKLVQCCADRLLIYCDSELIDGDGQPLGQCASDRVNPVTAGEPDKLLLSNCASGHAMLFRRELLNQALPFPPGVPHDWWLLYTAATLGPIAFLPEPLVQYRQHTANVTNFSQHQKSGNRDSKQQRRVQVLQRLKQFQSLNQRLGKPSPVLNDLIRHLESQRAQSLDLRLLTFLYRHRSDLYFVLKKNPFKKLHRIWKESLA